jgi:hypothetical protein
LLKSNSNSKTDKTYLEYLQPGDMCRLEENAPLDGTGFYTQYAVYRFRDDEHAKAWLSPPKNDGADLGLCSASDVEFKRSVPVMMYLGQIVGRSGGYPNEEPRGYEQEKTIGQYRSSFAYGLYKFELKGQFVYILEKELRTWITVL